MHPARRPRRLVAVAAAVVTLLFAGQPALALDSNVTVSVNSWSSSSGRAYIGVKANGRWAPPTTNRVRVRTEFYSEWVPRGNPAAYEHAWWVYIHRTADGSTVNYASPIGTFTNSYQPGIGIRPSGYGDLSLFLAVGVEPVTAPARSQRRVTAELTAGWRDWVDDAISAYVVRDSIRVTRWTIDFGDGTRRTFPADRSVPDRLVTTHAYEPGRFDVIVTAAVAGRAYGAFFTPDGTPYERVVPFSLDISNQARGGSALPIEYVLPVVSVGGSPSGTLPDGLIVAPDAAGHAAIWWPRGLLCRLYVRPIVETEGFMRSGGVRIGGARTRLSGYRYVGGANDATTASRPGSYPPDVPIRIQWNTPLPRQGRYEVPLVLELRTTYDDGTVRTSEVEGSVSVTVIYSAISP